MVCRIDFWTTGEPVPEAFAVGGRFIDMFRAALGGVEVELCEVDVRRPESVEQLLTSRAVIVSGSPHHTSEGLPWMVRASAALRQHVSQGTPILGVCFGHQLLGHALGGQVARNPIGREMGTVDLVFSGADPLLRETGVDGLTEVVAATHLDSVVELPPGAQVIARTELEQHAAVRFAPRAWGVQFHPEMGPDHIAAYAAARSEELAAAGLTVQSVVERLRHGAYGRRLLRRFVQECG
jgi:GMP synthase (glutamine-hydrolysing)